MGRVTTFRFMPGTMSAESRTARSLGETAGTGELAIPGKQDKPGQLDMTGPHGYPPKQYAIPPVPVGELKNADGDSLLHSPVKNSDGVLLGSLEHLIMDSNTGQIEYAVVLVNDTNALETVPWAHVKVRRDTDTTELVVNTRQYQLSPDITKKEMVDRSPDLEGMMKDVQSAKAPGDLRDAEGGEAKTHATKSKRSPDVCPNKDCRVIRGRVLQLEGESFMVKENSGSGMEVRMTVDRKTQKGQVGSVGRDEEFAVGDTIEAYITATGHAESISLMRPNSAGRPEEAGG
jgi:PRC-barrel domain protein